jgi:fructose-specific phosphotransferase system IIB component
LQLLADVLTSTLIWRKKMNLVAVVSCPLGLVTVHLAAAYLEKTARDLGHQIKVEIQGAAGVENELSSRDIGQAKNVILATSKEVKDPERFKGARVLRIALQDIVKNPREIFTKLQG